MKWFSRLGVYKLSNVIFRPSDMSAYSYKWWQFMGYAPSGALIFSDFSFSTSTSKHQRDVRRLVQNRMGRQIDFFLEMPNGVNDPRAAIDHYERMIRDTTAAINKPKTHKAKNAQRYTKIAHCYECISIIAREYKLGEVIFREHVVSFSTEMEKSLQALAG
jgi:hypothetical protein